LLSKVVRNSEAIFYKKNWVCPKKGEKDLFYHRKKETNLLKFKKKSKYRCFMILLKY
jgi:hypothetical protein